MMRLSLSSLSYDSASPTVPPSLIDVGIGVVVGMAGWTMRLGCMYRGHSGAAKRIDPMRYRLHVRGIYATLVATEMVDLQTVGDGTDEKFVDHAVSAFHLPPAANHAVTAAGPTPNPVPAAVWRRILLGLRNAVGNRHSHKHAPQACAETPKCLVDGNVRYAERCCDVVGARSSAVALGNRPLLRPGKDPFGHALFYPAGRERLK
jgi:hypothetical protein